jgi:hypothetical protein
MVGYRNNPVQFFLTIYIEEKIWKFDRFEILPEVMHNQEY